MTAPAGCSFATELPRPRCVTAGNASAVRAERLVLAPDSMTSEPRLEVLVAGGRLEQVLAGAGSEPAGFSLAGGLPVLPKSEGFAPSPAGGCRLRAEVATPRLLVVPLPSRWANRGEP